MGEATEELFKAVARAVGKAGCPGTSVERYGLVSAVEATVGELHRVYRESGEWRRWAAALIGGPVASDEELRGEIARRVTGGSRGLALHGRWRVYFNKHGRADLPWCVAPDGGGWEIAVSTLEVTEKPRIHQLHQPATVVYDGGVILKAVYQPKATPDDEDGRPSAWIAVDGVLTVTGGKASIAATAAPEVQHP